jgi:fumarate hydratase subunit beta
MLRINTPIDKDALNSLKAGDEVLLNGTIYTARDMAHKRLCEAIYQGFPLPFDIAGAVIYYVGPSPAAEGMVIGSAGPTTSSRMDCFTPQLFERGLAATIGKGLRGQGVIDALKRFGGVHFSAIGGAGALLSKAIKSSEIIAYEDLATEAIRKLTVENFPAIVAYDCSGNSVYKTV